MSASLGTRDGLVLSNSCVLYSFLFTSIVCAFYCISKASNLASDYCMCAEGIRTYSLWLSVSFFINGLFILPWARRRKRRDRRSVEADVEFRWMKCCLFALLFVSFFVPDCHVVARTSVGYLALP